MADIFVSYKSEDRARARLVAQCLQAEGFDVWYDHALQTGQDYQEVIDRELRTALVVVVLWSSLSVKSRWVRSEATIGDRKGALAPAMVEACDLPTAFVLVQTADLSNWAGDRADPAWRAYAADIAAKVKRRKAEGASGSIVSQPDVELVFWQSVKDSTDASDFQSYIKRYPQGQFTDLAESRLAALTGSRKGRRKKPSALLPVAAIAAVAAIGFAAYAFRDQLALHQATASPSAPPAAADNKMAIDTAAAAREMDAAWAQANTAKSESAYEAFLQKFPAGPYADAARAALANSALSKANSQGTAMDAAWAEARRANTAAAYEGFLKTYPSGPYSDAARAALAGFVPATPTAPPSDSSADSNSGLAGVWTIFVSCPSGAKIQESEARFSDGRYSRRFGSPGTGGETFLTISLSAPGEIRAKGTILFDKAPALDFEGVASGGGGLFSGAARLNKESNCPFTATRKSN